MKTQGFFGCFRLPNPFCISRSASGARPGGGTIVALALVVLAAPLRAQLSNYHRLYSFGGGSVGVSSSSTPVYPLYALVADGQGNLYGTTIGGGSTGKGVFYRVRQDGAGFQVLRDIGLTSDEGSDVRGLTLATDGNLYGIASEGGAEGEGTLFKVRTDGSGFTVLHAFVPGDSRPLAAVTEGSDGKLYGTTRQGGEYSAGTVFRINRNGTDYQVLHTFTEFPIPGGNDSRILEESVIEGRDGVLYGVASSGGPGEAGTVFRMNRDGTGYRQLHGFTPGSGDGHLPVGRLLEASDGFLYGVTALGGGPNTNGTVFKISKDGAAYAVLKRFAGSDGELSSGPLWEGNFRAIYGSTQIGGKFGKGVLFKLNKDGTDFEVVHHFVGGTQGVALHSGITRGSDGALYGAGGGGDFGRGMVFRFGHMIGLTKAGESVELSYTGIPGYIYRVQRSTDLQSWTTLVSRYLKVNLEYHYTNSAPLPDAAFYRVIPASAAPP